MRSAPTIPYARLFGSGGIGYIREEEAMPGGSLLFMTVARRERRLREFEFDFEESASLCGMELLFVMLDFVGDVA